MGDAEHLLELMDEALQHAGNAQGAGAPAFDHGVRLFNQFKSHYDLIIARETGSRDMVAGSNHYPTWRSLIPSFSVQPQESSF